MGYLITETKFDRNFPLGDGRNIEESFSLYEKNWEKIVSVSKKFPKNLKKIFVFAPRLLKISVAAPACVKVYVNVATGVRGYTVRTLLAHSNV